MGINAKHRKKFKSGACVEYAPLVHDTPSRRWKELLRQARPEAVSEATAILERPSYFQQRSWFEKLSRRIGYALMGRKFAAA